MSKTTTDDLIQKEIEEFRKLWDENMPSNFGRLGAEQFLSSSLHKIRDEAKREGTGATNKFCVNHEKRVVELRCDNCNLGFCSKCVYEGECHERCIPDPEFKKVSLKEGE